MAIIPAELPLTPRALLAQGQNLGLGGRIGDGEAPDLAVRVAERHCRLIGPGRLNDGRRTPEPDPGRGAAANRPVRPDDRFDVPGPSCTRHHKRPAPANLAYGFATNVQSSAKPP